MRPRYVLKDDLLLDPCLDIVGNRLPNHFVDRTPDDSASELALLEALAAEMDDRDACVIFPEGGVVTDDARERAKEKIRTRDPSRFPRVESLRVLGPVRPGGSAALLRGSPDADLVIVTFTGLDSLQRLASAPRQIPLEEPVRVSIVRYPRAEVPGGDGFLPWLDRRWAECDLRISAQPGAARLRAL